MHMKLFKLAKSDEGPENECGGVQHKGTLAEQTGLCCIRILCIFCISKQFFGIFRLDGSPDVKAKRDLLHGHNHPTAPNLCGSQIAPFYNAIMGESLPKENFLAACKVGCNTCTNHSIRYTPRTLPSSNEEDRVNYAQNALISGGNEISVGVDENSS